jgi:hypothetical protein
MTVTILISVASLLFFGNKVCLLIGKSVGRKLGWFLGSFGALLFIIYFFLIGTPILSIMEIGLTILMTYRFIAGIKTNRSIENILGIITGGIIMLLTVITQEGLLTVAQLFGALGMLIGTYFLISREQVQIINWNARIGWLLYGIGHFFTSYIGYQKHEWIFFIFQSWQMLLCFGGFAISDQKKREIITVSILIIGTIASLIFTGLLVRL